MGAGSVTHHPLQEELKFILVLAVLRLPQLLLDDLQEKQHERVPPSEDTDRVEHPKLKDQKAPHLSLFELDVVDEFKRLLKNLRFVFSRQVVKSGISLHLENEQEHRRGLSSVRSLSSTRSR